MAWIFGYGSIMNPSSAEKTIRRPILEHGQRVALLKGHSRIWRVVVDVKMKSNLDKEYPAVFLDIVENSSTDCIGTLLNVNTDELLAFDRREEQYGRVNIRNFIYPAMEDDVFAYFGKDEFIHPPENSVVMTQYQKVIDDALSIWGNEFAIQYEKSTIKHKFSFVEGEYLFKSITQNSAAGR